ncbi:NAD(P)/FAD-dependent oxidoreductase [Metallibacterium sp.]|uniref:NAD(P)/FAD-dependent oxidoreductase n=1 Tax=Metallibacterium sp. TaxID=2940281 RepID=UPI002618409A|nr:NAD(P)/FAD-dependent oxidoreductase [Metallibacterium sp.]
MDALQVDVAIIGGGAAGLMCARVAGLRGRRVLLIEHAARVGKKILMSGGGRCNFTNTGATAANFISANPHFCKSALTRFTPRISSRWRAGRCVSTATELRAVAAQLQSWPLVASGTEGYRTAEVTLGGVDTDALSSTTMESRHVPRLYFIGEVVDVTGHLGGYNFQWAWASGHAAGSAA